MIKKFLNSMKFIKLGDILGIFIFILMIIPSLIFRLILKIQKKEIWLICEDGKEARDNGYHLFKYIRENYPNEDVYYVMDKKNSDYQKVEALGNIISYRSFKHWLFYMSDRYNIITHKHGNPCTPVFYVIHVYFNLYNNRIFLQHGITMNDVEFIKYKNCKFKMFICAALKEYEFVKENFGYKDKQVKLLGFSRFDNLYDAKINEKEIVIMPTWRSYISKSNIDFTKTEYYKRYNSLINNEELIKYIEKNNLKVYLYLHRNMQKYADDFNTNSKNIIIVKNNEVDIQKLIKDTSLMITDYSSVSLDFAYMNKPVIYYQFDKKIFFLKHLQKGYFSYDRDGFGEVIEKEQELVDKITTYCDNNYRIEKVYQDRTKEFFGLRDNKNSERIYRSLKEK